MTTPFLFGLEIETAPPTRRGDANVIPTLESIAEAERSGFDLVLLRDSFDRAPGADGFDALLVAATSAAATTSIGLIVVTDTIHTEPFHLAKNLATLDIVSSGRAAWAPTISTSSAAIDLFGRRSATERDALWREAGASVEVVGRLLDSWEDGAVIRDVETGRYIDRDLVHRIDFESEYFTIRGPSITPRSPQGQIPVLIDATIEGADELTSVADLVLIEALDPVDGAGQRQQILSRTTRDHAPKVLAAIDVALTASRAVRAERTVTEGARHFTGSPAELLEHLSAWQPFVDGVLVRPAADETTRNLLPSLPVRAVVGDEALLPATSSLSARLGIEHQPSRYAASGARGASS